MSAMEVGVFSPRRKSKKRISCSAYGCKSKSQKNLDLIFHGFPKENARYIYIKNIFGQIEKIDQFEAWKKALKMEGKVKEYMKVCSLHFKKDDYILPDVASKKKRLKSNAIPSCNLPYNHLDTSIKKEEEESERANVVFSKDCGGNRMKKIVDSANNTFFTGTSDIIKMEHVFIKEEKIDTESDWIEPQIVLTQDVGIQANIETPNIKRKPKFIDFMTNDNELSIFTGIGSMSILETIVDIATKAYKNHARYGGVKMTLREKIIMTYVKLKQNLSFSFLAIMFHCDTAKQCQQIFNDTLSLLSQCLEVAITWPSRVEISKNLPKCFQSFENARIIIDCIEVFIEQSKKQCYTNPVNGRNKSANTCKIITGLTPAGNISFISKPYDDKASLNDIVEQSNILNLLEPGDVVIVNESFNIDKLCEEKQCPCIKLKNKKFAEAKQHIEQSIERLKKFKIINNEMHVNLVPRIQGIFTIICATINLTSMIINDDNSRVINIKTE